ncbi:hypothetical protein [Microbacterium aureliae]
MTEQSSYPDQPAKGISRRTVTKAMAWSVPVVAVATAVPAYAASGGGPSGVFISACKQPGASCKKDYGFVKGYTFVISITNNTPQDVYIYPTLNGTVDPVFALDSEPDKNFNYNTAAEFTGGAIGAPLTAGELVTANGGSFQIIINAGTNGDSSNISATGGLYMGWGHTEVPGADPDHDYSTPPPLAATDPGYFFIPISFGSTPPCGTDCAPGGDESETGA